MLQQRASLIQSLSSETVSPDGLMQDEDIALVDPPAIVKRYSATEAMAMYAQAAAAEVQKVFTILEKKEDAAIGILDPWMNSEAHKIRVE